MDEPAYTPEPPPYLVGHSDHGDPECCGLILPAPAADAFQLRCNECGAVIGTAAATLAEAEEALMRMAIADGICSETCPRCGELNVFPGFTGMEAYVCRRCGSGVDVKRAVQ
jgi:hypothetical protein